MKRDLTKAPITKSLVVIAVPITLANILHLAYTLIDTFWVGRLGANAVAAVSMSFPILFLLLSFGMGMAMAGTILVAQYKGKGGVNNINYISAQMFSMIIVFSLVLSVLGYFVSEPILKAMGATPEILPDAVNYLQILFAGLIFSFLFFVFGSLMRGIGNVISPMIIMLGTVILNAFLDPAFIMGWGPIPALGVSGAAVVTIITQGLAGVIGLIILFGGKHGIKLRPKNFSPDFQLIWKIIKLGFPSSIEQAVRAIGMSVMFYIVAKFGADIIAAYGIGTRILSFAIIPSVGLAMATSTIAGQNIGAGQVEKAEKVTWISSAICFGILTIFGVITFGFAKELAQFFMPNEPVAISQTVSLLKIIALSFGFTGVQMVISGTLKGAGETFASMILSMIMIFILVPLAYIFSSFTPLLQKGIWWAYPITYVLAAFVTMIWFLTGKWKKRKITKEIVVEEEILAP